MDRIGPHRANDFSVHRLDELLESNLTRLKDAINEAILTSSRARERMSALEKLGHPVTLTVEIEVPPKEYLRAVVRVRRTKG